MPDRERAEAADSTVICNQRGEWVAVAGPESGLSLTMAAARHQADLDQPTLQERVERAGTLVLAFLDLFLGPEPPRRASCSEDGVQPKDCPSSPRARQAVFARPAREPALIKGAQAGVTASDWLLPAAPYNVAGRAQTSARAAGVEGHAAPVDCHVS